MAICQQPEQHMDDKVVGGVDEIVEPSVQRKRSRKTQHSGGSVKKGKGCSKKEDDTTGVLTDKTNKAVRCKVQKQKHIWIFITTR